MLGNVLRRAEVLATPAGTTLFVDDVPMPVEVTGWRLHWVLARDSAPAPEKAVQIIPRVDVRDDFMREDLELHPYSRVSQGTVLLAQRGGGMPTTAGEEADPDFQRATNPFAVRASNFGRLTYNVHGADRWGDVHTEARFYFGVPRTGNVVDANTLPLNTDMLVVQGETEGRQVAFGWSGAQRTFVLQMREANAPWVQLRRWTGKRPALTNWVKLGLSLREGHVVEAFLDGMAVFEADLGKRVMGPFHIASGEGLMEFDDVRAWSLPREEQPAASLCVKSREFAGKQRKSGSDPEEFEEWATSSRAFSRTAWTDPETGERVAGIITTLPLMGDIRYESVENSTVSGPLPEGMYEFRVQRSRDGQTPDVRTEPPIFALRAERRADDWLVEQIGSDAQEPVSGKALTAIRLSRLTEDENRIGLRTETGRKPVSDPVPGPVHVAVLRIVPTDGQMHFLLSPSPNHHSLRCANLVNEFFEEAPADWSWVEGAFRMDCRWACQNQWSFMACGATGLPYMTSKRTFAGDQIHEYYLCLRAVLPWDAGDHDFTFDPDIDRANNFERIRANAGWYNRRDLNFSFCSDGRDPLSGYSVVFGADDNTETRLLRKGRIVARTDKPEFLFPTDPSHRAVHWNWWKFTVRKRKNRIRVSLNDAVMFDYLDRDPLDQGHIGFWSVRNGFALSRVTSIAEKLGRRADVLYVSDDAESAWQPLLRDAVTLTRDGGSSLVRVTNNRGGGFLAVRYCPDEPVDLRQTPLLELPLEVKKGTAVNLHLFIGGESFIVRLGDAPLAEMKSLLTPEFEKGECFRIPTIPVERVRDSMCLGNVKPENGIVRMNLPAALQKLNRVPSQPLLTVMTLGNTSNGDYLMAGNGGNRTAASYRVGNPRFSPDP
jgi:hypothetical protein